MMFTSSRRSRSGRPLALAALVVLARVLSGCANSNEADLPVISSMTPAAGTPGTSVLMQGTGFGATAGTVAFQDTNLTFVNAPIVTWTDTGIVITVPALPSGGTQTANVGLRTSTGAVPALPATFNVSPSS